MDEKERKQKMGALQRVLEMLGMSAEPEKIQHSEKQEPKPEEMEVDRSGKLVPKKKKPESESY